jgi:exportin-7
MSGIRELLSKQIGLQHQENYHEFCRLLGRLKSNYQLSELVKTEGYLEWLNLASAFSVQSITNWQYSTNSIHYLLALWGRLVAAVPYVRIDAGTRGHSEALQKEVVTVVSTYIESMLSSVETVLMSEGSLDDPLEDEGSLKEQLERLPTICRFQYESVANLIIRKFDPLLNQYQEMISHLRSTSPINYPPDIARRMSVVEGQLTWLTYIVGAIIGGQSWSSAQMEDGEEIIDASISRRVLQLAQGIDYRLSSTNGLGKADPKLEISLLYYFQFFRRVYMFLCDQVGELILYSIICSTKFVIAC